MNYATPIGVLLGFVLCICLFEIKILPFFFSRNFSEDVLGWKESFDLLLSSKRESALLCLSVEGTCGLMCLGASSEGC